MKSKSDGFGKRKNTENTALASFTMSKSNNNGWMASSKKVPNGLSRCHTKRRMGAHDPAHPFFLYDTDFSIFFLNADFFFFEKSVFIPNEGWVWPHVPITSFGMMTTQAITDL